MVAIGVKMLKCFNCGNEYFDEDLILINQEHLCFQCANNLRNLKINKCYNMDCLNGMKLLKSDSIGLIVTDVPYGISFMNKEWDISVPSIEICKGMLRVLKSGAFAFILMSPRQDVLNKMIDNLHKANFETNFTSLYWTFSSGFPKAMNISKKVVNFLGVEREITQPETANYRADENTPFDMRNSNERERRDISVSKPAKSLDGSYGGFQPKPAVEVIIVVMKPLNQENYVQQALHNQKGITWLDDCRIPFESEQDFNNAIYGNATTIQHTEQKYGIISMETNVKSNIKGRFPANLLVSDDVLNDGKVTKGLNRPNLIGKDYGENVFVERKYRKNEFKENTALYDDSGSFSRYFSLDAWWQEKIKKLPDEVKKVFPFLIVPKASISEKNENLNGFEKQSIQPAGLVGAINKGTEKPRNLRSNIHPTVKPLDLMSYLMILGSRENDLVLDPFIGSGTTAIACRILNRNFIGFEINPEYCKIAETRLKDVMQQKKIFEAI